MLFYFFLCFLSIRTFKVIGDHPGFDGFFFILDVPPGLKFSTVQFMMVNQQSLKKK